MRGMPECLADVPQLKNWLGGCRSDRRRLAVTFDAGNLIQTIMIVALAVTSAQIRQCRLLRSATRICQPTAAGENAACGAGAGRGKKAWNGSQRPATLGP